VKQVFAYKLGMTQFINKDGTVFPATVLSMDESQVIDIRTLKKNGYSSIRVGVCATDKKKINKPQIGQFKKVNSFYKYIKEIRSEKEFEEDLIGKYILISTFKKGEKISVSGKTIGKGFQGTIKRWNFKRGLMSHGSKSHRIPGSIGGHTYPGRVFKGKKMAGHMGNKNATISNLEIIEIDEERNVIILKGAVPGFTGNILTLKGQGDLVIGEKHKKEEIVVDDSNQDKNDTKKEEKITVDENSNTEDTPSNSDKNPSDKVAISEDKKES